MIDFDFRRPTRRCFSSEREIGPGESFYSALIEDLQGQLVRHDFAEENWTGPPEGCVGWWRSRIPKLDKGRIYWAPPSILLAVFEHALEHDQQLAFVMALVLVRKRLLQWRDSVTHGDKRSLQLHDPKRNQSYEVEEQDLKPEQIQAIQNELAEKLFTDQVEHDGDSGMEANANETAE